MPYGVRAVESTAVLNIAILCQVYCDILRRAFDFDSTSVVLTLLGLHNHYFFLNIVQEVNMLYEWWVLDNYIQA